MAKIIGNTTATPNPRPDWLQNDENKADYIKNKPEVIVRSEIDNELNLESGNPVQNSTIAQRFNELDESLKEYIDEQNSEQDENLGKLETLVTETMKATEINKNSTDDQYSTAKATYDFVKAETAAMVDSAPETLDTLNELAAALGDDPNFATTVATQIGKKADKGAKGSTIKPIYFDENGAQEIAYTIEKSVPADAKFTDTTYTLIKDSTNKKIQLMNGETLVSEVDDNNTTYTIDGSLSTSSTNPIQNKVVAENINSLQEDIDANASEIEEINSKDLFETKHEEGNAIAVSDSAEASFAGMKLFGKTTQNGTPTPDNPVELKSVGDSGSFEVGVYGKNKLVAKYFTASNNYSSLVQVTNKMIIPKGTPVTVSVDVVADSTTKVYWNNTIDFLPTYKEVTVTTTKTRITYSFVASKDIETPNTTPIFAILSKCGLGDGISVTASNAQLEFNSVATEYEPCNKQTLTMPYTLRSAGVQDEIDFARGMKTQRILNLTADDIISVNRGIYGEAYRYVLGFDYFKAKEDVAISNLFTFNASVLGVNNIDKVISAYSPGDSRLYVRYDAITTEAEFLQFLKDNNFECNVILATPIETPLTETELNAYRQLYTNKSNTTILSEADMEVDYVVDSTSAEYIENRLEEVEKEIPTKTSQLTNDSSFVNQTGLDNALEDKLSFDEEIINSTSDVAKVVPEGSGKYAAINKVGGMSYKSRNLLEVTATTQTINGVTFTVNSDKSVTVSGTATNKISFGLTAVIPNIYTGCILSGCPNGSGGTYCFFVDYFNDSGWVASQYVYGGEAVLNKEEKNCMFYILVNSGVTVNTTLYPMLRRAEETNTTYKPYYSGLRNSYVNKITATGKNLLPYPFPNSSGTTYTSNGLTFTVDKDGIITINGTSTAHTTYYIARWLGSAKYDRYICVMSTDGIGITVYKAGNWFRVGNNKYLTISAGENLTELYLEFSSGKTFNNAKVKVMITTTPNYDYTPYREENTFIIPTGARGVGYGMGINESCYNYIDFERKVYVRNVEKRVLTENDNWQNFGAFGLNDFNNHATGADNFINDRLPINKAAQNAWDYAIGFNGASQYKNFLYVALPESVVTRGDIEAFKAWIAENPITIVYQIEPEETDISDYIQDNFIEVAAGGVITAINEYNYDAPTEISFFTSESPEKVIVADKIVGDLVGVAEEAQSLTGLESSITELNYLQGAKGNIQDQINDLETKAPSIVVDGALNTTSTNPVQNKVVNAAINAKANASDLTSHTGNKNNPHGVSLSQLGVTATAAELNALDGITATATELNYVDGVTSNIQTQLNGKSATSHTHSNYASTSHTHDSLNAIDLSNKTVSLNDYNLSSGSPKVVYYVCPTDGGGANITGRPNDSTKQAFNLKVESLRFGSTTDYITKQTYTMGAQKIIYVRYCTNGTWTAWEKVYTSTQKPTASEIGAAASSHTHNYAGSSSAGGAATSANRLYTPSIGTTAGTTYTIDTYLTLIKSTLPLETQGYYTWKHGWSYAGNGLLSATIGSTTHKIQLAGAHCEFNGSSNGEYVLRITTATTSGTTGASFTTGATYQYNYHGSGYTPTWTIDSSIVGLSVNGKTITYTKNNGTTGTITTQDTNTTYSTATTSANGLMSSTDKSKLDGIASGANAYSHPAYTARTGVPTANATLSHGGTFTVTQPVCDATGHITALNTRTYTLPADNNTTYSAATQSAQGLMSAADKKKLDGIATGANAYTLPTASSSTLGGVKTTSTVTSNSGYTACPIISGVPYYKDTNTTYSLSSFGITATAAELNYCDGVTSNIQTQLNNLASDIDLNAMNIDGAYDNVVSLYETYTGALNNLTAPGFYYVTNIDSTNYPVGTNGHVLVMANTTGSATHVRQVFWRAGTINSNSYQWYSRNLTSDGWSEWWLLSGTVARYSGTLTSGTANLGSIYGGSGGWIIVAQVGTNKNMTSVYIPRAFLTTDTTKWSFTLSGEGYYLIFYFYYSGTTLYVKIKTSSDTTNNAIKYVYAVS